MVYGNVDSIFMRVALVWHNAPSRRHHNGGSARCLQTQFDFSSASRGCFAVVDDAPGKISDAVLEKVKHFTIGFARAGEEPAAKGSGVVVRYGDLTGILTCAHVVDLLRRSKQPVGLVRLNRRRTDQFGVLEMDAVNTHAAYNDFSSAEDPDVAFIHLPPHLMGNIAKDCAVLDMERNGSKPEPEGGPFVLVHAVFGLVEEFTGATERQDGRATTVLRGVLTPGTLHDAGSDLVALECHGENLPYLPASFGGSSGGGLWRIYLRELADGRFEPVHYRLIGIAAREEKSVPPRLVCQGAGRLELLLEQVRDQRRTTTDRAG
jgi:hypothetical protein